jgi:hypothetical protein
LQTLKFPGGLRCVLYVVTDRSPSPRVNPLADLFSRPICASEIPTEPEEKRPVPYVSCPACEHVTFTRLSRRGPELCARCGAPLPVTPSVVTLSRYRALDGEPAREPQPIAA